MGLRGRGGGDGGLVVSMGWLSLCCPNYSSCPLRTKEVSMAEPGVPFSWDLKVVGAEMAASEALLFHLLG